MIPNSCSSTMSSQDKKIIHIHQPKLVEIQQTRTSQVSAILFFPLYIFLIHVMVLAVKPSIFFLHNLGSFLLLLSHSHLIWKFRQIPEGFPETGGNTRVKLRFVDVDRPEDPIYTGSPVQWLNKKDARVAVFENDRQITQGVLSKLQIEILAVHAEFFTERGQADFTKEEFSKQICIHKGNESVLTTVNLANGAAYIGSVIFTESSQRKRLRLTARVKRQVHTTRVQEAISDPFVVKDRRSECEYIQLSILSTIFFNYIALEI